MVEDVDDAERRGMKDADGAEGADDVGGVAGVSEGYSAAAMVLCFGGDHGAR